jgi:hypothetical protein
MVVMREMLCGIEGLAARIWEVPDDGRSSVAKHEQAAVTVTDFPAATRMARSVQSIASAGRIVDSIRRRFKARHVPRQKERTRCQSGKSRCAAHGAVAAA